MKVILEVRDSMLYDANNVYIGAWGDSYVSCKPDNKKADVVEMIKLGVSPDDIIRLDIHGVL